ncbi:lipid kinase [Leptolyngbya sp. 'hensonii']|uniref:YegS/Rv2252/BmrU family lipid kinase n=1 Tax=Leptolyngbya sp. 'hensonii' TaxID=1922337 RepID=UPI00094FE595|nr:YegS/Rv2252/BmrU family lipid kinase [Leptolyngbya sp. 'hensonii']OLP19971.1 lipid kinase [Leptolyngbya sp. 'hensonii']
MRRSACLIFNPVAGQRNPEIDLEIIRSILEPAIDLEIHITDPETDVGQLAKTAVEQGAEAILASGGDGTLSAAATPLIGTTIPLGVIPRGTANAFANATGIPTGIEAACQVILAGTTRTLDAARCNGKPMILKMDVGFEAETIEIADREAKNRLGNLAYILAALDQVKNLELFETRIETDDRVITVSAASVSVANAAPPTSILAQGPAQIIFDDGLLDLTILAPENVMHSFAIAYELFSSALAGAPTTRNGIGFLRDRRFLITTDSPQKVHVDGDLIGTTPVEVECIHRGLTVFAPLEAAQPIEHLEGLPDLVIEYKHPEGG